MAGKCSICSHEYVKRINQLIADGKPQTEIAQVYGVAQNSVSRHKRNCIPRKVELAVKNGSIAQGVSFLDRIRWNIEQTIKLYERNGQVDDKTALAALKEIREACKDEANGPNPAQVHLVAEMGFRDLAEAKRASDLLKSTSDMDEHVAAGQMVPFLKTYLVRYPEKRLEIMGEIAGEQG